MERSVDGQQYNGWNNHVLKFKVQHIMWLDDFRVNHKNKQRPKIRNGYGSFTLPDIETETATNTSVGASGSVPMYKCTYSCKYSKKMYRACSRLIYQRFDARSCKGKGRCAKSVQSIFTVLFSMASLYP